MLNPKVHGDISKRLEAFMKAEMAEHKQVISAHHKEMQAMRDSVREALEKFDSLFRHIEHELKDKSSFLKDLIDDIDIKIKSNQISISDQRNSIVSVFQTLNDLMSFSSKKSDLDNFKKIMDIELRETTGKHARSFEDFQQAVRISFDSLKEELLKLRAEMDKKFFELNDKIDEKSSISQMDKEGILKEVRVYDKTIFIMEKKIENLYTLIDRINKRGEECHKQV